MRCITIAAAVLCSVLATTVISQDAAAASGSGSGSAANKSPAEPQVDPVEAVEGADVTRRPRKVLSPIPISQPT